MPALASLLSLVLQNVVYFKVMLQIVIWADRIEIAENTNHIWCKHEQNLTWQMKGSSNGDKHSWLLQLNLVCPHLDLRDSFQCQHRWLSPYQMVPVAVINTYIRVFPKRRGNWLTPQYFESILHFNRTNSLAYTGLQLSHKTVCVIREGDIAEVTQFFRRQHEYKTTRQSK